MMRGDFESAWKQTDRIELPRQEAERSGSFTRAEHHLLWNGTPFENRRVLVRCEHGLGDSIQFLRYIPRLRQRARSVILKVQPMLLQLFTGMPSIDLLRDAWTTDPEPLHDVAIECMEFAYAFRDTVETLPAEVPYLPVEQIRVSSRAWEIRDQRRLNVGLIWASSAWDKTRSIRLEQLAPLASIPNIQFFSLQQGPEAAEAEFSPIPLQVLSPDTREIVDAAGAMLSMDLIITVDSMTAHLAGALGRPVWTLLQENADWRWMRGREDSPWYPTMRLFRQPQQGDWRPVVAQVASELKRLANCV
ncbi:MAG: ADP-heptose--LPS heptosyltransferase [Verrucomicrobiaceae bacterium]|nr:MAG: ADP-heptose--LPS heptosyltransferase [Verrucomicrobiaceae bacterium]